MSIAFFSLQVHQNTKNRQKLFLLPPHQQFRKPSKFCHGSDQGIVSSLYSYVHSVFWPCLCFLYEFGYTLTSFLYKAGSSCLCLWKRYDDQTSENISFQMHPCRWVMNWSSSILVLQYEIGLSYTIMKMEQQNTNSKEGVEVLQQVPFEDEMLGKGQLTSKVYHLQRFVFILIWLSSSTCYSKQILVTSKNI